MKKVILLMLFISFRLYAAPFVCDDTMYLAQNNPSQVTTRLTIVDDTVYPFLYTPVGAYQLKFNAIGFNPNDGLLWGMSTDASRLGATLIAVDDTGTIVSSDLIVGAPDYGYFSGDIGPAPDHNLFLHRGVEFIEIDTDTKTYVSTTMLSSIEPSFDIAYNSDDGLFYGVQQNNSRFMFSIDHTNGTVFTYSVSHADVSIFGSILADSQGRIYGNENTGNGLYQFSIVDGSKKLISSTVGGAGDGAFCQNATISFNDFGDAPDSYGTLLSNNGARHGLNQALRIGNNIDNDVNGFVNGINSGNAMDDDNTDLDDDDGVSFPTGLNVTTTSYSINVNVFNDFSDGSSLIGWIDFDRNGIFDADEASDGEFVFTSGSLQALSLSWPNVPADISAGITYVRVRLSSDLSLSASTPKGAFADGEVEDYQITVGSNPSINIVKTLIGSTVNNNDGTYTANLQFDVTNSGDVDLFNVQVVDNLSSVFSMATSFIVDSVTSSDFSVNGGFNGSGDTNMLVGSDGLIVGSSGVISMTVTVTPGATLDYINISTVRANTQGLTSVTDSDNENISFVELASIQINKSINGLVVNNGNGTYTLTFTMTANNTSNVPLNNVQITDNLAVRFTAATAFVVDSVSSSDFSVNASFDGVGDIGLLTGADSLAFGQSGSVDLTITVTPGATLIYSNRSNVSAISPANTNVSNGDRQGVSFGENPSIDVVKNLSGTPTNNNDGTYTATFDITITNTGDVNLSSVQVIDDLNTVFTLANGFVIDSVTSSDFTINGGFNGAGDINLLTAGDSLSVGSSGSLSMTLTLTPGTVLNYTNLVDANGDSPAGANVSDNDTALLGLSESPSITLNKSITGSVANNGDGTYTLTFTMTANNTGDVPLSSAQISDDLSTTFATATAFVVDSVTSSDFAVNPGYNGSGDINLLTGADSLAFGQGGSVDLTVTVTPGTILAYNNVANTSALSSAGANVIANDNVAILFAETPSINVSKTLSGTPVNNNDGSYTATFNFVVANTGDVDLVNIQVVDNLSIAFASASSFVVDSVTSSDFALNPGYNGSTDINLFDGTDSLSVGTNGAFTMTVTVTPGQTLNYINSVDVNAQSPANVTVNDNDMAALVLVEAPDILLNKTTNSLVVNNGDGTYTLTFTLTASNTGDVPINSLQITDDIATTFASATTFVIDSVSSLDFTVNGSYDGTGDINLLTGIDSLNFGQSGSVDLTITVTPGATLVYNNIANTSGLSPTNATVTANDSQGVSFGENPSIDVIKNLSGVPTNNNDGTYTATFDISITNTGDVDLSSVQVIDDLGTVFASSNGFVIDSVTSPDFTINGGFNGIGDSNLLTGGDSLSVGLSGSLSMTLTVTPGSVLNYTNLVDANGDSPAGANVSDNDTAILGLSESPSITLNKSINGSVANNGDGTYTLTFTIMANNSGDVPLSNVQITDNLATSFASATSFVVDSVTSSDLSINPGYNGTTDINLLNGSDVLETINISQSGSVDVTITVTPGATLVYNNIANTNGQSPANSIVTANDSAGVSFGENPNIAVTKTLIGSVVSNNDGTSTATFNFVVTNTGDVDLINIQALDNLGSVFSSATDFSIDSLSSSDFTVNGSYDGLGNSNMVSSGESLTVGSSGSITMTVTVRPGASLSYINIVNADGDSPAGTTVFDSDTLNIEFTALPPPVISPVTVPTLSEYSLMLMMMLLLFVAYTQRARLTKEL